MYNAFYYNGNYYLLPSPVSDRQSLLKMIEQGQSLRVILLREDHAVGNLGQSMAPYFLSGYHDVPCDLMIAEKDAVFPVQVTLYRQEEYNAKLRELILEKCPGCLRYKPLSSRVQGLYGHFAEMSLDGVCLFRQETKSTPRVFHHHLFFFGGFFKRFDYATYSAEKMKECLKESFYLCYADAELRDLGAQKQLRVSGRKNELLLPLLTNAISNYLAEICAQTYRIQLAEPITDVQSLLSTILSAEHREAFQKECKKYGVSIGVLAYDPQAGERIRKAIEPLTTHFFMFPLLCENRNEYYLLADTTHVLKELRFHSPLLQTYHTNFHVFGQDGAYRYDLSFLMTRTEL